MFPLRSLLETVLEAFHFDHETLEKQLVTIDSEGELSAPDGRNATSKYQSAANRNFVLHSCSQLLPAF